MTVPAAAGSFRLGEAQASASVVVKRGKTQGATDAQLLQVDPAVLVELAESARLATAHTRRSVTARATRSLSGWRRPGVCTNLGSRRR